ncbi:MAG: hypothetical protein JWQ63_2267 [Mucilaginibacter sp.]|nr:hypothetical protein [Mucilaginibacter sp.]
MNLVIEDNFIELQKKATHVLVEQKLILFEHGQVDTFLDKINEIRATHTKLIPYYKTVIEMVVSFLEKSQPIEELVSVSESINNLVFTTTRLIQSFAEGKLKDCFVNEIKEYNVLLNDINEILIDIQNRMTCDSEMTDLLNSL